MAGEPENMTLVMLRGMDAKLDCVVDEMRDMKVRMTAVEMQIGTIDSRLDRIDGRLDRIERRFELVEAPQI